MKLRLIKAGVALACGVLLFLSCADFDIWPLTWIAVAPLIAVVLHPSTKRPAVYGFLCGLTANGGGFYWIVGFLQRFGHLPIAASAPIFALLIGYQATTFALFAWVLRRIHDRLPQIPVVILAPVSYVSLELVMPFIFPWYLAITQAWHPLAIQVAELTGPLGVSFILVMVNAAIYAATKKQMRQVAGAAVAMALVLGFGALRIHQVSAARDAAPKLKVGVVQANIGIHEKWVPNMATSNLATHQALSKKLEEEGADLIVWPESSYPFFFERSQKHDWPETSPQEARRGFHTPLLFGSLTADRIAPYPYNSALLLDKEGDVRGLFDKNILMVFGEYVPFYEQMRWLKKYIPDISNWSRGTDVTVFPFDAPPGSAAKPIKIAPMICYEDIFPSFGRRLAKLEPNLMINITNDAWFGRTSEPYEHMALSVYRAVELRLDLVRAVNTGVSAFIDSTGKLTKKTASVDPEEKPSAPPTTLLGEVAVQQASTIYGTVGEAFGGLCLVVLCYFALRARAAAGSPVRWPLVLVGALSLAVFISLMVAILVGPSQVELAWILLSHRKIPAGTAEIAFHTGVWLIPILAIGSLIAGLVLARIARRATGAAPPVIESVLAIVAIMIIPAVLFGTLEGEQAGLVIGALIAGLLSRFGANRWRQPA